MNLSKNWRVALSCAMTLALLPWFASESADPQKLKRVCLESRIRRFEALGMIGPASEACLELMDLAPTDPGTRLRMARFAYLSGRPADGCRYILEAPPGPIPNSLVVALYLCARATNDETLQAQCQVFTLKRQAMRNVSGREAAIAASILKALEGDASGAMASLSAILDSDPPDREVASLMAAMKSGAFSREMEAACFGLGRL